MSNCFLLITMASELRLPAHSGRCDPPPPKAPPIGSTATLLRNHHQCLDSMGGFCLRRYQHLYPWSLGKQQWDDSEIKERMFLGNNAPRDILSAALFE
ncbi:hypothetical protein EYF80_011220 [Liparis tanakae]|uniref:Uncharacterized protein n=1 Tax=Liparis tanakae TaxID=230148 RepID=A0A4Z2ILA7_9TELE|nr:hypothetical protein EYF80_011220 [Liparis tanakae]